MKRWVLAGAAVVLGVAALTAYGRAQGERGWGPDTRGRGGFRMGPRLLAFLENDRVKTELGLTDDQTSRLRQIIVEAQKSSVKTGADMAVRGIELRELMQVEQPDRAAIMKKVQELSDLRGQMMKQHVESLLAAKTVLTPEQQKKVRAFLASGQRGFGQRRFGREGFQRRMRPPNAPPPAPDAPGAPPTN